MRKVVCDPLANLTPPWCVFLAAPATFVSYSLGIPT